MSALLAWRLVTADCSFPLIYTEIAAGGTDPAAALARKRHNIYESMT
jgi:hypothetical protein